MSNLKIVWILVILSLTAGCAHYSYIPNMHNVPLFQKEKELHMNFSSCISNGFNGCEAQAAFSVSNHLGIIVNHFSHPFLYLLSHDDDKCKGHLIEGGAGVFFPLNKHLVFETYTGIGFGKIKNIYRSWSYTTFKYNRYFLQPSIGFTSNFFNTAFALRINGIRYNDIQYTEILGIDEQDQIQYINRNPFSILIEPGVILRIRDEFLKFQVEAGYSGNISNTDLLQEDFYFSFGFRISIANFIRAMFSHASDQ
jgi:hypothetical protein